MKKWNLISWLFLILLVTANTAMAQVSVDQAYVSALGGKRVATFPTGSQIVSTFFAVKGLPANSSWKLSYFQPSGVLSTTDSGTYNNPAAPPNTTVVYTRIVSRFLSLTKGDWHIQLAINGQAATDIYFSVGLSVPVLDHAIVISQDFLSAQTQFDVGVNLIGSTAWATNIAAGSWVRLRYQRPDGTIAADNTWDAQFPNSFNGFVGARWFVNLNQTGTWHLIFDLNGQTLTTNDFQVGESVTDAKLGIPLYGSNYQANDAIRLNLYVKGHSLGNLHVKGRLLVDEKLFTPFEGDLDLSDGGWKPYYLPSIPTSLIQGNHTIRAVVDSPNSVSSGKTTSAVSGFNLLQHSFKFKNLTGGIFDGTPLSGDGMCLGMARVANDDFVKGIPVPPDSPKPSRPITTLVYNSFMNGNAWLYAPFLNGGNGWTRLYNYPNDDVAIATETSRLHNHLQALRSWVMLAKSKRDGSAGAHAVVATAEFFCENPYVVGFENDKYNVRVFPVYDSNNNLGEYGYIAIFENTAIPSGSGRFSMTFANYPSLRFPFEFSEDLY